MGRENNTHYDRLGIPPNANAREIRRSYRRLARRHHPDLNPDPGSARQFAALSNAYSVLNDPVRRARYDRTLRPPRTVSLPDRGPVGPRTFTRAIVELSPCEARHLAHQPLALVDRNGRTIVLPAGIGEGHEIIILYNGRPVVLTIHLQRKA